MSISAIHAAIPHRPPFLLVDEIISQDESRIVCRKAFNGDEWFFAGHYPEYPLVPGVLLCEAALQAGAVLMGKITTGNGDGNGSAMPVVTRLNDVRFKQMVRPGESIEIEVRMREKLADAYFFDAKVTCNDKLAVRLEFACMLAARPAMTT